MSKNKKFIIFVAVFMLAISVFLASALMISNKEKELYEKIFNLDWSEHLPNNYSGFIHWPYMKDNVFMQEDGWRYIKADMRHDQYPWLDKTVALRYNVDTYEQLITFWGNNTVVKT